ncbi:hypothetical protein J1G33_20405 [Pseudomonas sp. P867]|uniref:hypothetical protein n=1 Tax=Pseudomonas sp. P867 TaxID=2816050 RepID=UPI001CA65FDF|nr:hypothetical protein [Pseudomonas sp. P867]MBY8972756.1 hypothetical protein [Pseudomonas sp. P867]
MSGNHFVTELSQINNYLLLAEIISNIKESARVHDPFFVRDLEELSKAMFEHCEQIRSLSNMASKVLPRTNSPALLLIKK